jgi:hypothetical protein
LTLPNISSCGHLETLPHYPGRAGISSPINNFNRQGAVVGLPPLIPGARNLDKPREKPLRLSDIKVPSGPDWLHEVKYDGYRLRMERDGDHVRLITKGGHDGDRPIDRRGGATGVQLLANGNQSSTSLIATDWRGGWVVGVGAEWGFAPGWSAKIEYDHFDFGSKDEVSVLSTGTLSNVRSALTVDMVKGGFNYRFNWGAPVVARY